MLFSACASKFSGQSSPESVNSGLRRQDPTATSAQQPGSSTRTQTPVQPSTAIKNNTSDLQPSSNFRNVLDAPEIGKYYQTARRNYDSGNRREGLNQISSYYRNYPQGQFADEAAYLLAKQAMDKNDFTTASQYYSAIESLSPPSRLRGDSTFLKSVCVYNLGQRKEALEVLSRIDLKEVSAPVRPQVFPFWGRVASEEGRILESNLAFIKARKETADSKSQGDVEKIIVDQIENQLSEKELEFLLGEYPSEFPAGHVQMRLVMIKLAAGLRDEAQALLQSVISGSATGTALNIRASQMLTRINSVSEVQNKKVGFLLPMSGERSVVGKSFLDGLKLSLKGLETNPFEIVVADTGPTLDTAKAAFERLVFEDKVMAVVGPITRISADWVAEKSVEYGIPHIALSGKPGLLDKGNYVFTMALSPARQIRTLVKHCVEKLGARRFAILFPEDSFGRDVSIEYFKAVNEYGGMVTAADSYNPEDSDFRVPIENMVGKAFPGFRKKETEENLKLFEEKFSRKPNNKELDAVSLPPIVDFDVLFLPDKYKTVGQIAPALAYTDISQVQLIGPSTWNNKDLLKRSGSFLEKSLFVDSFSLDRKSRITRDFIEKYKVEKGVLPSSVSAQGNDVGLVMKSIFTQKGSPLTREELRKNLEMLGSFDGAQGVYTWNENRDALSEVQLFEIHKSDFIYQGGILTQ